MIPPSLLTPLQRFSRRLRRLITGGCAVDLPDLFARFQAVLTVKNRALEIVTDMGEKLGGDYLFDINYTQGAYALLFKAMEESVSAFARLTDNRYPELAEVLARVDGLVRRMLTNDGPGSDKLVLFHGDITWDLVGEVGGKNYQLAVLHNELKLLVPPAFAISTAAFLIPRRARIGWPASSSGGITPFNPDRLRKSAGIAGFPGEKVSRDSPGISM